MKEILSNSLISRQKKIVFNKIDDEIVMMNIENNEYYGTDNIGARIWEIIEKPITFKGLVDLVLDEYDVTETNCVEDMKSFLYSLYEKNIIEII